VPDTFSVSAARLARAFAIGRRSIARIRVGIARVMSTETMWSRARSAGKSWRVVTTLSHAMTTFAPWSSNWWRSSLGV